MPFDPEDLSRRLRVVQAQQNARSEQRRARAADAARKGQAPDKPAQAGTSVGARPEAPRRRSRDEGSSRNRSQPTGPRPQTHYIPQNAASQFATTTTADNMTNPRVIHRLSHKALKFHLSGPNAAIPADSNTAPIDQSRALRDAQEQRDRVYERNQFQRDRILEAAAEADEEREKQQPKHSFEDYLSNSRRSQDVAKRMSGGDPLAVQKSQDTVESNAAIPPHDPNEHRVDWTQSDEPTGGKSKSKLRKPESIWTLRGRLGSLTKHGREEKTIMSHIPEDSLNVGGASLKSPKSSFFARLRVSH